MSDRLSDVEQAIDQVYSLLASPAFADLDLIAVLEVCAALVCRFVAHSVRDRAQASEVIEAYWNILGETLNANWQAQRDTIARNTH